MKNSIFILLFLAITACKGSKESGANLTADANKKAQTTTDQVTSYKDIAAEKLGTDGVLFEMNEDQSMVLCKKVTMTKHIPMSPAGGGGGFGGNGNNNIKSKPLPSGPTGNVKLIVVKIATGEVLYEKSIAYGSADWASNTELKLIQITGAYNPNMSNGTLYDVVKKTSTPIGGKQGGDKLIKP